MTATERSGSPAASRRLRASQRIKRNAEFQAARAGGRRLDCGAFTLTCWQRPGATGTRVGVVASRASVGGAVDRSRAKRRLRELFRRNQSLVPAGFDLILTARAAILTTEFSVLEKRFIDACSRLSPGKNA